ncbi:hypothetical protein KAK07_03570 [Ideonella sp. 4Y16]|uniref:Uncharacterized protein n=1 Tax=Ideonella alba TaxID=2824118 RepID=A0A940YD41_9BURK|nr:hypothetical protein [Ideonella alba]MBQ0930926.1 hypothetical protein [Ideonella alba]MBQ0942410.1 hypothetical protein [Ideonella alba]
MPKLILHVGTGKTGTTSIQLALKRNEEALAQLGYHVVESRRTMPRSAKHKLAWDNPDHPGWAEWAAEAARVLPTGRHMILSNEGLWRLDPDHLSHFAEVFKGFEPMVVMYVREQVEWIQSSLLQKQKQVYKRFDLDSDDRVNRWIRRRPLDYLKVCQGMELALGEGCVHARVFQRSSFYDKDLLADFFHAIGIAEPQKLNLEQEETNPSLAAQFAALLMKVKRDEGASSLRNKQVQDLACRLTANGVGSRFFMSRERVAELRERFRVSNELFAKRYLKNGDALPMKDAWLPDNIDSVEVIEAKVMEVLDRLHMITQRGWQGQARVFYSLFPEGWTLEAVPGTDLATARPKGPVGVVNFRLPFRRRYRHKGTIRVDMRTTDGRSLLANVSVNGHPAQTLDVGREEICFPVEWTDPIDEVRMELAFVGDIAAMPAVVGIDVPSVKSTDGDSDDDDDLDDEDDDD